MLSYLRGLLKISLNNSPFPLYTTSSCANHFFVIVVWKEVFKNTTCLNTLWPKVLALAWAPCVTLHVLSELWSWALPCSDTRAMLFPLCCSWGEILCLWIPEELSSHNSWSLSLWMGALLLPLILSGHTESAPCSLRVLYPVQNFCVQASVDQLFTLGGWNL